MVNVSIAAKFRDGRIGVLSFGGEKWTSVDMSYEIPAQALPLLIYEIELRTDSGVFRQTINTNPIITLKQHLRHWWSINLGCSK
jgi:hypothetical protein